MADKKPTRHPGDQATARARETNPPRSFDPDAPTVDNPRDEAKPGTPGTGPDIAPKTGETFTEGVGGA